MKYVRAIAGVIGGFLFAVIMAQAAAMLHSLVAMLAGWAIGTLGGTSIAARIGRSPIPAYVLGAFFFGAGVYNSAVVPQPVWFSIASWIIFVVMTFAGAKLGTIRTNVIPSVARDLGGGEARD